LESTKGIEIKLDTYIEVQKTRTNFGSVYKQQNEAPYCRLVFPRTTSKSRHRENCYISWLL